MRSIYSTQRWQRLRRMVLSSAPLCRSCKAQAKDEIPAASQVDHIIPISEGGEPWDMDNLQPLCASCHSVKTARDNGKNVSMGCDINGMPLDPTHPWNRGEGRVEDLSA